ncbi:MAG: adenosylhomocysteine nucleosidase [Chthoniobacter sp.]|jgi:adenosylhomocysteine nucleosidase|nr:adenosylhomocysteine nucleosidase [Chthoniobacter sp.]
MIAVTFALPQESKGLARYLVRDRTTKARGSFLTGTIGQREVAICHTGIGVEPARRALRELMKLHRPRALISAGFAGGLDPRLQIADLLVATNFSDPDLLDATRHLCMEGRHCYFGTMTTQPQAAETTESKFLLAWQTGASVVDMETAAIVEACRGFGLPMLSIRSVSDIAGESLPIPFPVWFDIKKQKPRVLPLLHYLVRHPRQIAPFAHFVLGVNRARARLTDYLLELIPSL